jgi:hypothetical protein
MDNSDNKGFFLVGTGRCGTTMFRKLLSFHPDLYLPKETHWIPILYNSFGLQKVPHVEIFRFLDQVYMAKGRTAIDRILKTEGLDKNKFRKALTARLSPSGEDTIAGFMNAFYSFIAERNGASLWGDKTPDYGLCMSTLQTIWPDAKFVHIYRDGRDVAISMSKVLSFRLLAAWEINHWYAIAYNKQYELRMSAAMSSLPIEKFFELWKSRVSRIFDERDRLRKENYMEIRYENLLGNPLETLTSVSNFLNLPERKNWMNEAAATIRSDNIGKNRDDKDYMKLTRKYADDLIRLGFQP